ncbi:MAG: YjbH domain-containing protein [bacterium]|nr:YjbH domain-containing protein [bacterium]
MKWKSASAITIAVIFSLATAPHAQVDEIDNGHTLYDIPPRTLVDLPTAGTLPRGTFNIGLRLYAEGGALGYTDIGLSNRLMLGISYGGIDIVSNDSPDWNPGIAFNLKFRVIDEMEVFPAVTVGFSDQGHGPFVDGWDRFVFKSRGFYAVTSRSFYFYKWTSSWHFGVNYSREYKGDDDKDVNIFAGFDATFNYNLALLLEYDAAFNDDGGDHTEISGKGRGYLNLSVKWLFANNLEMEVLAKDLLINRREAETFSRGIRIIYIDSF